MRRSSDQSAVMTPAAPSSRCAVCRRRTAALPGGGEAHRRARRTTVDGASPSRLPRPTRALRRAARPSPPRFQGDPDRIHPLASDVDLCELAERVHVHLEAGSHGAAHVHAQEVLALGARGFVLLHRLLHCLEVGQQVRILEGALPEGYVHDALLVAAELELARLEVRHGGGHVGRHSARLGGRHEPLGPEHAPELGDLGHGGGRGDKHVKVQDPRVDGLHQVVHAHDVRASGRGRVRHGPVREHRDAHLLARALGKRDGGAQLLVVVFGVQCQADVRLRGLRELGAGHLLHHLDGLCGLVELLLVHEFGRRGHAL
mmetsp:Transcript_24106/g.70997  ORF Transcript_24106/g.70997 Transcript_24106/m.70997 type:complete len:316 (+) Transcript_24106:269-1216(+)